jgi:NADH:ubiquinone oxidoreductase subunit 6 (subunit J)
MFMEIHCILLCAFLSLCVCWTRSPFMSLMYSVLLFINATFVLLLLGFQFLALVNLLVYVGALAVLFLFVIMLLEIPATELRAFHRGWSVLGLLGALASRVVLLPWPLEGVGAQSWALPSWSLPCGFEALSVLGHGLFLRYADLLMLNSLVLTVALFGALALAHLRP